MSEKEKCTCDRDPIDNGHLFDCNRMKQDLCTACDHTFHHGRCFHTMVVGRNYIECRCKKGIA